MKLDSHFRLSFVVIVMTAITFSGAHNAKAQDVDGEVVVTPQASPMPAEAKKAPPEIPQSLPPDAALDSSEITVLRDNYAGKYNVATLENLSMMYWRLGAFDLQDDLAIGNYLKITDCPVFTNYVNDDMEWTKIVDVMRGHLKEKRGTFPLTFQFLIELHLGRYDPERGGFALIDQTGFKEAKRIEVDSIDARKEICYDSEAIEDYPKSMFILLPQQFTLDFIKLDEHVAQAYILRKKSEFSKLAEDVRVKRYERDAFLRLRVSFSQYHGNLRGDAGRLMGILYGNIDGYEIFEDSAEKRLMLSVDLSKNNQNFNNGEKTSMISMPIPTQIVSAERDNKNAIAATDHIINEIKPPSVAFVEPAAGGVMPISHSFAP